MRPLWCLSVRQLHVYSNSFSVVKVFKLLISNPGIYNSFFFYSKLLEISPQMLNSSITCFSLTHFMPFVSFYTPLKTSENQRFSDVFRGYRKRPVAWNGLTFPIITYYYSYDIWFSNGGHEKRTVIWNELRSMPQQISRTSNILKY